MFRSTLMCGNRLNAWNTMPMRWRIRFTSTPRAVISSPSIRIRPRSIGSSRFTHRSNVDLPEPDAPIRPDDLVVVDLEVDPLQHLELVEGLVEALDPERDRPIGGHSAPTCRRRRSRSMSQSTNRACGIVITM